VGTVFAAACGRMFGVYLLIMTAVTATRRPMRCRRQSDECGVGVGIRCSGGAINHYEKSGTSSAQFSQLLTRI
jgi:hypothetical protein